MKSNLADLSVRNSGLNTMFNLGYLFFNFLVVPGVTVDLNNIILSFLGFNKLISSNISYTISKLTEPSVLDGVGTDKNINSDDKVSDKECVDLNSSLSYILTSASQPVCAENPNATD